VRLSSTFEAIAKPFGVYFLEAPERMSGTGKTTETSLKRKKIKELFSKSLELRSLRYGEDENPPLSAIAWSSRSLVARSENLLHDLLPAVLRLCSGFRLKAAVACAPHALKSAQVRIPSHFVS
jgi:hypothetical protein